MKAWGAVLVVLAAVLALAGAAHTIRPIGGSADAAATGYRITSLWQIAPKVRARLAPKVSYVDSEANYCAGTCAAALATAYCPRGATAIGGTAAASTPGTPVHTFIAPGFYVAVADAPPGAAGTLRVTAICTTPAISGTGSGIAKRDWLAMDDATRLAQALSH